MIKTIWEYSLKTEAERLLHTAHQIAVGFYKVNNFIVLPYGPTYRDSSIVTFPDLPYYQIPRFWDKVKAVDIRDIPVKAQPDLVAAVAKLLEAAKLQKPGIEKLQANWAKASHEIIHKIEQIIPSKKRAIEKIVIYPTRFGTGGSFNRPAKFPATVHVYLREDQSIYSITEALLSALTRHEVYTQLEGVWQESELLADWLVGYSSIAEVLKKYQPKGTHSPTMKYTRIKQRADLVAASGDFYKKLGVPAFEHVFDLKGNIPYIQNNSIENLNDREKQILSLMIRKGSSITTIDELADILFEGNEDAFSLQAIAKQIQRLRDKLEANGVSGSFIQTKRGQGYMLVN